MRINYKTHPILGALKKQSLYPITYLKTDDPISPDLKNHLDKWDLFSDDFASEITCVSKTFEDAACGAWKQLAPLWVQYLKEGTPFSIKGTWVLSDVVYMFKMVREKQGENPDSVLYIFHKTGVPIFVQIESEQYGIEPYLWISSSWGIEDADRAWFYFGWEECKRIFVYDLFKKYASVETKVLEPNKKIKELHCKYLNETDFKITHLDSRWFTNLIKSDGFNVRGHFRLQPKKKDGQWTRELIWINEFQKKGYTAPAKKLNSEFA